MATPAQVERAVLSLTGDPSNTGTGRRQLTRHGGPGASSEKEVGALHCVHIAQPGVKNTIAAAVLRNFKDGITGVVSALGKKHLQRACNVVEQDLMKRETQLDSIFDKLNVMPQGFSSPDVVSSLRSRLVIHSSDLLLGEASEARQRGQGDWIC